MAITTRSDVIDGATKEELRIAIRAVCAARLTPIRVAEEAILDPTQ